MTTTNTTSTKKIDADLVTTCEYRIRKIDDEWCAVWYDADGKKCEARTYYSGGDDAEARDDARATAIDSAKRHAKSVGRPEAIVVEGSTITFPAISRTNAIIAELRNDPFAAGDIVTIGNGSVRYKYLGSFHDGQRDQIRSLLKTVANGRERRVERSRLVAVPTDDTPTDDTPTDEYTDAPQVGDTVRIDGTNTTTRYTLVGILSRLGATCGRIRHHDDPAQTSVVRFDILRRVAPVDATPPIERVELLPGDTVKIGDDDRSYRFVCAQRYAERGDRLFATILDNRTGARGTVPYDALVQVRALAKIDESSRTDTNANLAELVTTNARVAVFFPDSRGVIVGTLQPHYKGFVVRNRDGVNFKFHRVDVDFANTTPGSFPNCGEPYAGSIHLLRSEDDRPFDPDPNDALIDAVSVVLSDPAIARHVDPKCREQILDAVRPFDPVRAGTIERRLVPYARERFDERILAARDALRDALTATAGIVD